MSELKERVVASGTAIEQVLAYVGVGLWGVAAFVGVRRGLEGFPVSGWVLAGIGAGLGVVSLIEVHDWWRRVPTRGVASRRRAETGKRAIPALAWFAVGAVVPFVTARQLVPTVAWLALLAGALGGKILSWWLAKRSDRRDGWKVLHAAGVGPVSAPGDLAFFDEPPGAITARRSAVVPVHVPFGPEQLRAFGLSGREPQRCLVVVDPTFDDLWAVTMMTAVADALDSLGVSAVAHERWIRHPRGFSMTWSLEREASGAELADRLRAEPILVEDGIDVLTWTADALVPEVLAWSLPPGYLLEQAFPSSEDGEVWATAFFVVGDRAEDLLAAIRHAVATVGA